jgi:hypothetical protein
MVQSEELTEAWCIVKDLWPQLVVEVGWDNGQVRIAVDAELAQQVRPGQRAPVLEGRARVYRAPTWEEAIRAAGEGEGVSAAKIEDRIATSQRARRDGLSVYFTPMV